MLRTLYLYTDPLFYFSFRSFRTSTPLHWRLINPPRFLFFITRAKQTLKRKYSPAVGGGGSPLHKLYRYVPPHRVGFLCRLGLKTVIHFVHLGLESGMVLEGTTGLYERLYRFNSR